MPLIGPDGRPLLIPPVVHPTIKPKDEAASIPNVPKVEVAKARFVPTRQLLRAYLRQVAMSHINRHFGPEPRKVRRALGLALAKNKRFRQEVKDATAIG